MLVFAGPFDCVLDLGNTYFSDSVLSIQSSLRHLLSVSFHFFFSFVRLSVPFFLVWLVVVFSYPVRLAFHFHLLYPPICDHFSFDSSPSPFQSDHMIPVELYLSLG